MPQFPIEHDGHYFHIIVRMLSKPHAACNLVIVQYPQRSEMDTPGIEIICKTKGMVGFKPAMACMSTGIRTVHNSFHKTISLLITNFNITMNFHLIADD